MLVLTRLPSETVVINGDIVMQILEVRGDKVRLGFTAPKDVSIWRGEIFARLEERPKLDQAAQAQPETNAQADASSDPAQ